MNPNAVLCSSCGSQVARNLLVCPLCQHLVYAGALKHLAAQAEQAERDGDLPAAIAAWRKALQLIPPKAVQSTEISARVTDLLNRSGATRSSSIWATIRKAGPLGTVLLLFGKAKFLLLGLTKAGTLFSMLLSFGLYWSLFGWQFALGLLLCIYVHEMGHVAALLRYGIPASMPMFVPGLGAFIRMHQRPANPVEDATVGLAGPLWGLGATLSAELLAIFTGQQSFAAIANASAWLNLINLLPVWQLDGARGFQALSTPQRWIMVAIFGGLFFVTYDPLLILIAGASVLRAFSKTAPAEGSQSILLRFAFLAISLALLTLAPHPLLTR